MQSSIPYDPSLVLGSVLSNATVQLIKEISQVLEPANTALDELEALLACRKSLDTTKAELNNLGVDTSQLDEELNNLNSRIATAASDYAKTKLEAEAKVTSLQAKIQSAVRSTQLESPIDRSKAGSMSAQLAAESLKLDVQYFVMDPNMETSTNFAGNVSSFVSGATSWLGGKLSSEMSQAAKAQVLQQVNKHDIVGTLVLSASCTHKNGSMLEPFALDADKGVKIWNRMFPNDKIVTSATTELAELAVAADWDDSDEKLSIVSGMSFGSSFIGMVHILNSSSTEVKETPSVRSHVTFLTMGTIPEVTLYESRPDRQGLDALLPAFQRVQLNAGVDNAALDPSQLGQDLVGSTLTRVNSSISKLVDIGFMTAALNDYLQKASSGSSGVPLNYHLREVTKNEIAAAWVAKYCP